MRIPTKSADGEYNGYVITIWNANEHPELRPDQVYLTAVAPHSFKGPHLHKIRRGMFCCIQGNVRIVTREGEEYKTQYTGEDHFHAVINVAPGTPACIYNDGYREALLLNMPSPAWSREQQDEWSVENWKP